VSRPRALRELMSRRVVIAIAPVALAFIAILLAVVLRNRVMPPALAELALAPPAAGDPAGALVRAGSIHLPRGGPYLFGVWSSGRFRLTVGGHTIDGLGTIDPARGNPARVVLPAGIAPIRLAAGADARLVWLPPGRRGEVEYVPNASLAAAPPEQAQFTESAGTSTVDGLVALFVGLILAALGAYYLRHRWRSAAPARAIAVGAVFALALVVRLYDLGAAGQTFDEDVTWSAGRNYVQNLLEFDGSEQAWRWNLEHPPVTKYIAGVGALLSDGYGTARALSALAVAGACALITLIGARLYRPRVGWVAGVTAALTPHLIAHGQIVGHEAFTCLWWALGLWLALSIHDGDSGAPDPVALSPRLRMRLVGLGLVVGLAIATRFINGLLLPLVVALVAARAPGGQRLRAGAWASFLVPAIAVVTVIVVWPRLWSSPIAHLEEAWARLGKTHAAEPYLGLFTASPPRTYFLVYLYATAPVALVAGAGLFVARAAAMVRAPERGRELASAGVVLAWFVVPLAIMASPVRQDGVRYVLPSVMALALMSAVGVDGLARLIGKWAPLEVLGFPILVAGLLGYLGHTVVQAHPYYLDYYGEQVGGTATVAARRQFETAWWGEGLDRAVEYVNDHARPTAVVHRECIEPVKHLGWFRADLWAPMTTDARVAEWIVVYQPTAGRCRVPPDARLVLTVDAMGAPLAQVFQRDSVATP
jgi:4-amino-4-deoxy-L-arabinose transferase-like glycosyltransferase